MTAHHSWKPFGAAVGLVAGLAAGASFSAAQAAAVFNDPADVKAITAIEDDLQTQTDMTKVIGYYAPDAFVLDMMAPGVYKGKDQIYAGFEPQFAPLKSMTHTMPEMNIASDGVLACAAMQIHFDVTMKNGQSTSMAVREIDAFRKIDGQWKIIQQHISMPADAKTGMALMTGPPVPRGDMAWVANPLPGPAESPEAAKAEIRHWMDVGVLSTSVDQLMTYYGPGDDVLIYDTYAPPGELRGLKEIHDYYAPLMGSFTDPKVNMPEFAADSDGLFGVQIDTQDMVLTMKDGSKNHLSLRQSDCMRRVDGKWYSFFEMISYPADPKTGKAIMSNPGAIQ